MPNSRGRPKGFRQPKRIPDSRFRDLQERKVREFQLIYEALTSAGYFVWKQFNSSVWNTMSGGQRYEIHFLSDASPRWCVLPVNRSIVRDRIIALINKALSGEIDGSKPTPSIKA